MKRLSARSAILAPIAAPLLALGAATGCDDATATRGPLPPNGIVVLNGAGQTGITLVSPTSGATSQIRFDDTFDGGAFVVERDSALSTSSALKGDLLWVVDLRVGSVIKVQMPAGSDPSSAAFLHGAGGYAYGVALRRSGGLALVTTHGPADGIATTVVPSAGRCPTDLFEHGGSVYVVDANADCANFAASGVARLIRFTTDGVAHDTIGLAAGAISTSATAVVSGDFAYVASGGDADFSNYPAPPTITRPGIVTKVNLTTKQAVGSLALPTGTYGAGLHLGLDRRLYVTAYSDNTFAHQQVFAIDPATMAFAGPRASGSQALDLRATGESGFSCGAATADALGQIYCVTVDYGSAGASTLSVFDATGLFVRSTAVGEYGFDVALR